MCVNPGLTPTYMYDLYVDSIDTFFPLILLRNFVSVGLNVLHFIGEGEELHRISFYVIRGLNRKTNNSRD